MKIWGDGRCNHVYVAKMAMSSEVFASYKVIYSNNLYQLR